MTDEARLGVCIAVQEMESGKRWDWDRMELVDKDAPTDDEILEGIGQ